MELEMILLAAGESRRFGSNKLLFPLEGEPLFKRSLTTLVSAASRLSAGVTVVTRFPEVREAAEEMGARVLDNPRYQEGLSSSVKIGLEESLSRQACLFAPADQPWLSEDTIVRLAELFISSGKGLASLSYQGRRGSPGIFSRKYFPELMKISGDTGGRGILRAHPEDLVLLEVEDPRELMDVDLPEAIK